MGISGTMDYISDLVRHKGKKRKQFLTVHLKIKMDCDGCEHKVKNALSSLSGVEKVDIIRKYRMVSVTGYVDQSEVLKAAKSTGKKAEIWPYVPYYLVTQPYSSQSYDKKAPPGHAKKDENTTKLPDDPYTTMFSDDNPNACSIM